MASAFVLIGSFTKDRLNMFPNSMSCFKGTGPVHLGPQGNRLAARPLTAAIAAQSPVLMTGSTALVDYNDYCLQTQPERDLPAAVVC